MGDAKKVNGIPLKEWRRVHLLSRKMARNMPMLMLLLQAKAPAPMQRVKTLWSNGESHLAKRQLRRPIMARKPHQLQLGFNRTNSLASKRLPAPTRSRGLHGCIPVKSFSLPLSIPPKYSISLDKPSALGTFGAPYRLATCVSASRLSSPALSSET